MDARRLRFALGVCIGTLVPVCAGCRTATTSPSDPFATTARAADAATNAPGVTNSTSNVPGTSIAPVAYSAEAAPGTSLNAEFTETPPSKWQQMTHALSPTEMKKTFQRVTGHAPDENLARRAYNEGDALFREGKFDEAAAKFDVAADRWPQSLLEEDALYMLGESYFFADRYTKARDAFERLLKNYENSRHLDRATAREFALARYWEEEGRNHHLMTPNLTDKKRPLFDTHGGGIKTYETIRLSDPTGPLADDALMAQATAYFLDDRHEDAAYHYEILRKDYPQSEHQKQAHLLGLQSYMNAYQGPQYDPTPLQSAEKLCDQTIKNFGREMPDEATRLQQAKEAIRAQRAEREFDLGEYYRRLGYNRAARRHYAVVLRDFPDTKFSNLAQQRTQETENLADEPPDYFPWLTKWLARDRPQ